MGSFLVSFGGLGCGFFGFGFLVFCFPVGAECHDDPGAVVGSIGRVHEGFAVDGVFKRLFGVFDEVVFEADDGQGVAGRPVVDGVDQAFFDLAAWGAFGEFYNGNGYCEDDDGCEVEGEEEKSEDSVHEKEALSGVKWKEPKRFKGACKIQVRQKIRKRMKAEG